MILGVLALAGCATPPPPDDPEALAHYREINDPLEPLNRAMFDANRVIDILLIRPLAESYNELVPAAVKLPVRSFLDNLASPVIFANELMQGKFERAGITLARFGFNSGLGFFGFADVASDMGLPRHKEDFGQTLAVWGVGEGPYLVLPVFGPSNPRDGVGLLVDSVMDPFTYLVGPAEFHWGRYGADGTDRRAAVLDQLDDIERTSLDFYATIRSLYRQQREDEIRDGRRRGPPASPFASEREGERS